MRLRAPRFLLAVTAAAMAASIAVAAPASANSTSVGGSAGLSGATTVTTAPGIAAALVSKGVVPLPQLPDTGFRLGFRDGLTASYRFPITGGNPNLAGPSGDIRHRGGIYFLSARAHLSISDFDIDLAAGKVYATKVDGAPARVAILDLNLSGLTVTTRGDATVLSGITVTLDAQAAAALDATFANLNLPAGLAFGSATVTLRTS